MKLDFFKLSIKKELFWLKNTKKTFLVLLIVFIMPFSAKKYSEMFSNLIVADKIPFIIILVGIVIIVAQYFLDSIYHDIIRKVNNFYFNLSIPLKYNLYAKMLICFLLSIFYIICSLIIMKDSLNLFQAIIAFEIFINSSLISYILINYLYSPDSMVSSIYITFIVLFLIVFLTIVFRTFLFQSLLHFGLLVTEIFALRSFYQSKRIRLKIL